MTLLFLAGQPGLDFLNTAYVKPADGTSVELIGDGEGLVTWLLAAGLLDRPGASRLKRRSSGRELDEAAAEARRFRQWATEWIVRWSRAPHADSEPELRRLNGLLERARCQRRVVAAKPAWKLVERCPIEAASELLPLLAVQIAALVTGEAPELVKRCAGTDCVLWFVDRTKAHSRLFCSAAACGNRAKVAAFRERQRSQ